MAENAEEQVVTSGGGGSPKPTLFIILLAVNMLFIGGVGALLYLNKKKEDAKPTLEKVIEGEHETQVKEAQEEDEFLGTLVPMDTFLVNLADTRGGRLARVNLQLEVDSMKVQEEIDKRRPQIRDIIIILLSSKTYEQVAVREGKDFLRDEIKDTVNSFLSKGKIKQVYFTEFILN